MPLASTWARDDRLRRGVEAGAPESAQVSLVGPGRPHGQGPAPAKRPQAAANARVAVQAVVRFVNEGDGAVVDVERDDIVAARALRKARAPRAPPHPPPPPAPRAA